MFYTAINHDSGRLLAQIFLVQWATAVTLISVLWLADVDFIFLILFFFKAPVVVALFMIDSRIERKW